MATYQRCRRAFAGKYSTVLSSHRRAIYGGFPTSVEGMAVAKEVFDEED